MICTWSLVVNKPSAGPARDGKSPVKWAYFYTKFNSNSNQLSAQHYHNDIFFNMYGYEVNYEDYIELAGYVVNLKV